ncbi:glycosyltransferase [Ammoniphilus sp. 3BR4]|uniref:glycosyltransferase n=1 Tax=Ammoniphilus sp. 3BR4 TaxID=3158265 RepID=UPI003466228B
MRLHDVDCMLKNLNRDVSIIIPIFNAFEDVEKCVQSVLDKTTAPYKLILIDDCSTDKRIHSLLKRIEPRDHVVIIRNDVNKGFVESVNLGIQMADSDVILLNSDTIVTPRWLQKLMIAAYSDHRIGTVTPLSNAAGLFSVPHPNENNPIPPHLGIDGMAKVVESSSNYEYPIVPTGHGFCLYIKKQLIDEIGLFNSVLFKRGYGEENDFCMRAAKKGWKNIIDDSTFIYHKRSASFKEEKDSLYKKNREILAKLYPDYSNLIKQFKESPEWGAVCERIRKRMNLPDHSMEEKRRILYVLHGGSGGTPQSNKDLMKYLEKKYECYVLVSDAEQIKLYIFRDHDMLYLHHWNLEPRWKVTDFHRKDFRTIYFRLLHLLKIDLVHIRHLISHTFDLPHIANILGIKVILSIHDFYFACPSIHLLDDHNQYCGGRCTAGEGLCKIPHQFKQDMPPLKHKWVFTWRQEVNSLLGACHGFVTTSETPFEVHTRIYPVLKEKIFALIEHGREQINVNKKETFEFPIPDKPIKILFPGNIGHHKGLDFILKLKKADQSNKLEFHFMGRINPILRSIGVDHGEYQRDQFYDYAKKIKPSFAAIFSITPETYCHTLSEAWMCGIPVLGSGLGAVKERIEKHGGGWLIDVNDPEKTHKQILKIASDRPEYERIKQKVDNIGMKPIFEMGKEYEQLYMQVLSAPLFCRLPYPARLSSNCEMALKKQQQAKVPDNKGNRNNVPNGYHWAKADKKDFRNIGSIRQARHWNRGNSRSI